MRPGLTIGEFAALTHLSVRTLRRYHEAGLLEPARVDTFTGYRYYSAEQIPPAQVIHRLRELDVPLAEVKSILATDDPRRRADLIAGHLRAWRSSWTAPGPRSCRCASCCAPTRLTSRSSCARCRPGPSPPSPAGSRSTDVLAWYAAAMAELDAAYPAGRTHRPTRRPLRQRAVHRGRRGGDGVPPGPRAAAGPAGSRRSSCRPIDLAVAVHRGPHDDIDVTYGRLGAWVVEHALAVDGPVYETYVVGPRDTDATRPVAHGDRLARLPRHPRLRSAAAAQQPPQVSGDPPRRQRHDGDHQPAGVVHHGSDHIQPSAAPAHQRPCRT